VVFGRGWSAEELDLALSDAQGDPLVDEFAERLVSGHAAEDLGDAVGPNKAADGLAAMDVGQLVVGTMSLGMLRMHAAAAGSAADLILAGDAAGMHGV